MPETGNNDDEIPRPNESLEAQSYARHLSNLHTTTTDYHEDFEGNNEDYTTKIHLDQIPLILPSSPIGNNNSSAPISHHQINTSDTDRSVTNFPIITDPIKQEDVPLPTIAPLNHDILQRRRYSLNSLKIWKMIKFLLYFKLNVEVKDLTLISSNFKIKPNFWTHILRLSTSEPDDISKSIEDEDRARKLASVEGRQRAVEIDVNTPLSVLDLPPFDSDDIMINKGANQRTIDMSSASKQVGKFDEMFLK